MNRKAAVLELLEQRRCTVPEMAERLFGENTRTTRNRVHGVLRELHSLGYIERVGVAPRMGEDLGNGRRFLPGRPATVWRIVSEDSADASQ